ncbi:MAG: hypothetical protein KKA16_12935 [Alphaproteobacteria bacterium]|nr:hypothetical protein [Alphaproteobacteria bacterium]MBU2379152.1 hypothetical protein [Alphaproteobacteria bacterium]
MTRLSAILIAALIAAAPLSAATAQDRGGRNDRDRSEASREPRRISQAEAQGIARSRAGDARLVGSMGMRGNSYVFRFERRRSNDRPAEVFDIAVDSRGG